MTRIDYVNDPNAPPANCVVPWADIVVANDDGDILVVRWIDDGSLTLPGGGMSLGESIAQTAIRQTRDETGIEVGLTGLVGIYTDPRHVIAYTDDGEVRQEFSIVFTGTPIRGALRAGSESSDVFWASPDSIAGARTHPTMQQSIAHYLEGRPGPFLG